MAFRSYTLGTPFQILAKNRPYPSRYSFRKLRAKSNQVPSSRSGIYKEGLNMKYYEMITFTPKYDPGKDNKSPLGRRFHNVAWAEQVACAILNHLKEDCCFRASKVLELLVEIDRLDLLPGDRSGKSTDEIESWKLSGAASKKFTSAFNGTDHLYFSEVAIIKHTENILLDAGGSYKSNLYHFMLHPDDIAKMQRLGKLPGGKADNRGSVFLIVKI